MKVNGQQPSHLTELTAGKTKEKGQKIAQSRSQRSKDAEVVTNRASLTAKKIKETLRNEPDVRPNRVDEVKEKILNGKYQVNPEKLAENMLLASLKEDLEKP